MATVAAFLVGLLVNPLSINAAGSNDPLDPIANPVPAPEYVDDDFSFVVELSYAPPNGAVTHVSTKVVRGGAAALQIEKQDNTLKLLNDAGGELFSATLADPSEARREPGGFYKQPGNVFLSAPYDPLARTLVFGDLLPPGEILRVDLTQGIADFCTSFKEDATCKRNLRAVITDTPDPVLAGNQLFYKATLANDGPNAAFNVELDIDLPAGLTAAPVPAGCTVQPDGDLTCKEAVLNANASKDYNLNVKVPSGFLNGNGISKSVSATATASSPAGSDTNTSNDSATTTTLIKSQASLALTKTCPIKVIPGSNYTCTVTITNSGPSDADKVVLTDDLPANIAVVGTPGGGGFTCSKTTSSPELTCSRAPLAPGGSLTFTVTALLSDELLPGAALTNTASVKSVTPDPVPTNNTASRTSKVPDCERKGTTLQGTSAAEVLCGTSGVDNIHGNGGDDLIFTLEGNDTLHGGEGVDNLFGGTGNDDLQGGNGNDRLFGNAGNDILQGGPGTDHGVGSTGTDTCLSTESGTC